MLTFLARFTASFATFAHLTNDERTRNFLTLEIGAGHEKVSCTYSCTVPILCRSPHAQIKALSEALTPTLNLLRQKTFYSEPRFHASFAWALIQPSSHLLDSALPPKACDASEHQSTLPPVIERTPILATREASPVLPTSKASFPAVSCLDEMLLRDLIAAHGKALATSKTGAFDVERICVRIGQDVCSWKLQG
jgi:hypothetical protein